MAALQVRDDALELRRVGPLAAEAVGVGDEDALAGRVVQRLRDERPVTRVGDRGPEFGTGADGYIAAIDATTGLATTWDPAANGQVKVT